MIKNQSAASLNEMERGGNELLHYGILGMKWGVRKEYEPKSKTVKGPQSTNESQLANRSKTITTPEGNTVIHIRNEDDSQKSESFLDFIDQAAPDRYASSGQALKSFNNLPIQKDFSDGLEVIDKYLEPGVQAYATNHNASNYMRTINCFECSMAYELRMRGYNVQSKEMNGGYDDEVLHCFNVKDSFNVKVAPNKNNSSDQDLAKECYKQIEQQCLLYGDGARGCLGISYYDYDGGHSMVWTVENGEFKILDSQHNGKNGYETFLHAKADVNVYRLDNAEVLPGVTDFVEPFKLTDEERERIAELMTTKAKAAKDRADAAKKKLEEAAKKKKREESKQEAINTVKTIIDKVGKATSDFINKGKEFLTNLFKH